MHSWSRLLPWSKTLGLGALATGALVLCGCPNPNTYGTARTLDPGKFNVTVAPEAYGFSVKDSKGNTLSGAVPMLPTVGARVGIADGFDVGGRLPNLDSLAADGKVRLLKGDVDLALDPGLQYYHLSLSSSSTSGSTTSSSSSDTSILYLYAPAIIDINLSKTFSLVASPGVAYGLSSSTVSNGSDIQTASGSSGFFARMGVGFDLRTSKHFALHPEVTFMKGFKDSNALLYTIGLGFNFGENPSFDDVGKE